MAYLNGLVGHHGELGCQLYCPVPGRGSHYYPALLKPVDYVMPGCDHDDLPYTISMVSYSNLYLTNLDYLLKSPNKTKYKKRRLETSITKPTIFLGVHPNKILGIPECFGSNIMHLATFNLSDLLVSLWRGEGSPFVYEEELKAKLKEVDDQLHAIWSVFLYLGVHTSH
jgi:hypothetical protein